MTTEGEEIRRSCSQLLVMFDATIIIDSYSERSPHIYNIKPSELYVLKKRGTQQRNYYELVRLERCGDGLNPCPHLP